MYTVPALQIFLQQKTSRRNIIVKPSVQQIKKHKHICRNNLTAMEASLQLSSPCYREWILLSITRTTQVNMARVQRGFIFPAERGRIRAVSKMNWISGINGTCKDLSGRFTGCTDKPAVRDKYALCPVGSQPVKENHPPLPLRLSRPSLSFPPELQTPPPLIR